MNLDALRMVLRPGPGLAARFPGLALLIPAFTEDQRDVVDRIIAAAAAASAAPEPGRVLSRALAALLAGQGGERAPPLCAIGVIGDDVGMIVYGDAVVEAAGEVSSLHVSGSEASTWVDRIISGSFQSIAMKTTGTADLDAASIFELKEGVAPAEALLLTTAAPAPEAAPRLEPPPASREQEPAAPAVSEPPPASTPPPRLDKIDLTPPPVPEPVALDETLSVVSLRDAAGSERRAPLPVVEAAAEGPLASPSSARGATVKGVRCKHGHFNHPNALYCAYDGSALVDITRVQVDGPRPSLGVLVFDDGSTYGLESGYVLGRAPQGHEALSAGAALALVVDDAREHVSRSHLLLELSGWDVRITDLGSQNGTFVLPPDGQEPLRLTPSEPLTIEPRTRVRLGERSFVYESHHRL